MNIFLLALIVALGINLLMFIPAYRFKTDKLTDISYAITFAVLAVTGFWSSDRTSLHWALLVMIVVWACRLGGFLLIRVWKKGKDARFDNMRDNFLLFLRFWVLQGVSVFVIMLAAISGFKQTNTTLSIMAWLGVAIFTAGLLIEATADWQKYRFSHDPKNRDKWIDSGVWRASRHPNYLGEMMVWTGVFIAVAPTLTGFTGLLVAIISPVYIVSLLLFVSGVPILEKSAQKRWGDKAAFKTYQKEVPVLLPTLNSIRRIAK